MYTTRDHDVLKESGKKKISVGAPGTTAPVSDKEVRAQTLEYQTGCLIRKWRLGRLKAVLYFGLPPQLLRHSAAIVSRLPQGCACTASFCRDLFLHCGDLSSVCEEEEEEAERVSLPWMPLP